MQQRIALEQQEDCPLEDQYFRMLADRQQALGSENPRLGNHQRKRSSTLVGGGGGKRQELQDRNQAHLYIRKGSGGVE